MTWRLAERAPHKDGTNIGDFLRGELWRTCRYKSSRDHEAKITWCLFASYFLKFIYFSFHLRHARVTHLYFLSLRLLARYFSRFDLNYLVRIVFFLYVHFCYILPLCSGEFFPMHDKFLLHFPPQYHFFLSSALLLVFSFISFVHYFIYQSVYPLAYPINKVHSSPSNRNGGENNR